MKKSVQALAAEARLLIATLFVEAAVRVVPADSDQGRLLARCAADWALRSLSSDGQNQPASAAGDMVRPRSWEEFRATGLLWWVNRTLHLFGWAIVCIVEEDTGKVLDAYPARVKFRGFDAQSEAEGFVQLSAHLEQNASALAREAQD